MGKLEKWKYNKDKHAIICCEVVAENLTNKNKNSARQVQPKGRKFGSDNKLISNNSTIR